MEGYAVARWKRFGHDRAYVTHTDGTKVGFRDLLTGVDHPEASELAEVLATAVEDWLFVESSASLRKEDPYEEEPRKGPQAQCVDLAANRPGSMARLQAEEEWERRKAAHPFFSRVGRILNVHTDERAWRMGADGEEAVGRRLEQLAAKDPRWRVLHAVPVGSRGSDIDHVVIGPGGAFTINAKHHDDGKVWIGGDTLMVNGHRQPYVRNSRHEATRASRLLAQRCGFDVQVCGVIALVGVIDIKLKQAPKDVHIVRRKDIVRWLRSLPPSLTDDAVGLIYEQARRSTTWTC